MKNLLKNGFKSLFFLAMLGWLSTLNVQAQQQKIPAETEKVLIEKLLKRAFVTEKDAPDYAYLTDKEKIIISTERPSLNHPNKPAETLTKSQLPEFENVKLKLKTPKQIKRIGKKENLLYASILQVENYTPESVIIELEMNWAMSKRSIKRGLLSKSGTGYSVIFKKIDGNWDEGKIIRKWVN